MKKIMFLSLVVGMFCGGNNAVAGNNCSIQQTHWAGGTMWGHSKEYLFVDGKAYTEKQGFICGRKHCSTDTYIAITGARARLHPAISEYGLSLYKCELRGDVYTWDSVAGVNVIADCSGDVQNWTRMGEIGAVEIYCKNAIATRSDNGFYCLGKSNMCKKSGGGSGITSETDSNKKTDTPGECEEGEGKATADDAQIKWSNLCKDCSTLIKDKCYSKKMLECYRAMSKNNDVWWNGYDKCFCKKGNSVSLWQDGKCGVSEELTFCQNLQENSATEERMACCWAGKDTEWVDANGDNAKDSTGKEGEYCKCTSGDMNWDETEKKCKAKKAADNNTECSVTINVDVKCENGRFFKIEKVFTTTKEKAEDCDNWEAALRDEINSLTNKTVSGNAKSNIKELDDLIAEVCKVSATDIENAKLKMEAFFKTAADEASVWKTESGSFNSARLASDLTAGVVLGTVGGIVTGNIIKKNQIKKGYEVLHCTIGGQTVADWGDEFNVGLNR